MLDPNFLCSCGHRNKMHTTADDALKYLSINGRICVEYANYPDPEGSEVICSCRDFKPDNLKTLELLSADNSSL